MTQPSPTSSPAGTPPATGGPNAPEPWGWTRRQRLGLGLLLTLLLAILGIQFARRPARLDDPLLPDQPALPQRVDPNTATREELARIPHLGDALAQKIIDYREPRKPNSPDAIVFRQPSDLDPIPGIGQKLIDQLAPFLKFPGEQSP